MFRNWLLEEEEKAKVGRPKLADDEVIKKSRWLIIIAIILASGLLIFGYSKVNNTSPLKLLYSFTFEKVFGTIENKDGFIVKTYYDKNKDYIMNIIPSDKVKSYQGKYKYTLYKLNNNEWKKIDTKVIDNNNSFKIKIQSMINQNVTYKINLKITNSSKIDKSFAPSSWQYVDSIKDSSKYTYKVFTVRGYYSPITLNEVKEGKNKKDKIVIETSKEHPRSFIITSPVKAKVRVSYTVDDKVIRMDEKELNDSLKVNIPKLKKASIVTFKIYADDLKKYKLSNFILSDDKKYIKNTYVLKPESAY